MFDIQYIYIMYMNQHNHQGIQCNILIAISKELCFIIINKLVNKINIYRLRHALFHIGRLAIIQRPHILVQGEPASRFESRKVTRVLRERSGFNLFILHVYNYI